MPLIVTPSRLSQFGEFYDQLAGMLAAGVGLIQSLETIRASPPHRSFREPLGAVIDRLKQGYVLSEALNAMPSWIPAFDVALIQAGEQSGTLDGSFRLLADYYRNRARSVRSALSDLAYPVALAHLAIVVFPPGLLGRAVWQGEWQTLIWSKLAILLPLYALVFLFVAGTQARWGGWMRTWQERALRVVPLVGAARRALALARLSLALRVLLNAGVSIIQAWDLAASASGSPAIARAVAGFLPHVASGERPGELLGQYSVFPEMFVSLYRTGEMSGKIDGTLVHLHEHYQGVGSRKIREAAEWLPRIVYVIILLAIAYFVVSFWLNYFNERLNPLDS